MNEKFKNALLWLIAILCITSTHAHAMKKNEKTNYIDDFSEIWKEIELLEESGKTKSALAKVEKIFSTAQMDGNEPQIIKSLLHKYKYWMALEEESEIKIVNDLTKNIDGQFGNVKYLMQSMLAEMYWQYYQGHKYQFLERTTLSEKSNDDFRYWDLNTLLDEVTKLYLNSIEDVESLRKQSIQEFSEIILNDGEEAELRPTLYDLLVHRVVDFFMQNETGLIDWKNPFNLNDPKYFEKSEVFIKIEFPKVEIPYPSQGVLQSLQSLTKFRLKQDNLNALADVELKRINYVFQKANYESKGQDYMQALFHLREKYSNNPIEAEVIFYIANYYHQKKISSSEDLKKALQLCDEAIVKYKSAFGTSKCENLKQQILKQNLTVQMENAVVPKQGFKALINYHNTSAIYHKLLRLNHEEWSEINSAGYNKQVNQLNKKTALSEWSQNMPASEDLLPHSAELIIEALPVGHYVLMSSTHPKFKDDGEAVVVNSFWATDLSFTFYGNNPSNPEVVVVDRFSGNALSGVAVEVFQNQYDYQTRKQKKVIVDQGITDSEGVFRMNVSTLSNRNSLLVEVSKDEDRFISGHHFYYNNKQNYNQTSSTRSFIFTDRSIYRPGQTVHFKAIVLNTTGEKNELSKEFTQDFTLKDANYQDIEKLTLTTNEFGSCSGSFRLPETGLLGQFQIFSNTGSQSIRVEEYKRPKFEVKLDTVNKAYNINDEVSISGRSVTYSGVNLNDAKIDFRVVREVQYPIFRYSYWRPYPQGSTQEIISGTTTADADGVFNFVFNAIPDMTIDPESKPYFNYKVVVDVTDITGETHSAIAYVKVGYVAIDLKAAIPETIQSSHNQTFHIETNNLNGKPEPSPVDLKIYLLKSPSGWRKDRFWKAPDQFFYTREKHDELLPYELYQDEMNPINWEKENLVYDLEFNTRSQTKIDVSSSVFIAGRRYLVEIQTKDKAGNELKLEKVVIANELIETKYNIPTVIDWQFSTEEVEPGDVLKYTLSSSEKVHLKMEISFKGEYVFEQWIDLDAEQKLFSLPIKEEWKGGLECQVSLMYKNRFFSLNQFIDVLHPDNQLKINWISFRDKLQPGQEEEWIMEILLPDNRKSHAELLATMYDASLDALYPHNFDFSIIRPKYSHSLSRPVNHSIGIANGHVYAQNLNPYIGFKYRQYPEINLFGFTLSPYGKFYNQVIEVTGKTHKRSEKNEAVMIDQVIEESFAPAAGSDDGEDANNGVDERDLNQQSVEMENIALRENFAETALFEPHLITDSMGQIKISFKIPESVTKWKIRALGHDQNLNYKHFTDDFITQKEVMVESFPPRFLRQGDKVRLAAKVSNLTDKSVDAKVSLKLIDALSQNEITAGLFYDSREKNITDYAPEDIAIKQVSIEAGESVSVFWWLNIPDDLNALTYEIKAAAGQFTDGERSTIPVLTNRSLVTETLPLPIRAGQQKAFKFEHLAESGASQTLLHHGITLEMTANPIWYVVQALPYLMEYPYDCAEQIFSRFYGNALGIHIVNEMPVIKNVFAQWENTDALISNLEKNQELKSIFLEESPWVRDAINETEQKKRIALLFDIHNMAKNQGETLEKLLKMQLPNGGFSWFPGMQDNWYITQYILEGFGHLFKLGVIKENQYPQLDKMLVHAIHYVDDRANEAFSDIKRDDKKYRKNDHLSNLLIHYMYTRTFYHEKVNTSEVDELMDYLLEQGDKFWINKGMQEKALLALGMSRISESATPMKIMTYFDENAIVSEELGMYWKALESGGYYWHQAPVETQALIIEAYAEVKKDLKAVDELKIWLLKQKQVQNWKSTKSTAEACYALLLQGSDWLNAKSDLIINMGSVSISSEKDAIEAGTGYVKKSWAAAEVKENMANIEIINKGEVPAWGSVYWQYFEDIDKVKQAETNLKLTKELFIEQPSDRGPVLKNIDKQDVKIGDLIKVRITLTTDRSMEYVHMKDLRASGLEPVNVLSQYKYQDRLGYYEMTKDAATHFFFDWLPKGEYVFEYGLRVAHAGEFSNGFTNIECMYAPEFKSHSKGSTLMVTE